MKYIIIYIYTPELIDYHTMCSFITITSEDHGHIYLHPSTVITTIHRTTLFYHSGLTLLTLPQFSLPDLPQLLHLLPACRAKSLELGQPVFRQILTTGFTPTQLPLLPQLPHLLDFSFPSPSVHFGHLHSAFAPNVCATSPFHSLGVVGI